jgi:hypothetical protein
LHKQKSNTTCCGVNQRSLARLQRERTATQVVSGHSLKHRCGSLLEPKFVRNANQTAGWYHGVFGIATYLTNISNAITHLHDGNFFAELCDNSRTFLSVYKWQWGRVSPFTEINVNEINPSGVQSNKRLTRFRLGHREINNC